jgi:A/G-specific adenine glycosylase
MPMHSFASRLITWQRRCGRRDLPWQDTRDPYLIWLSEIMLQQTQVSTVIPYYQRFVSEFPDVRALAAAPLGRVLELWSGLGYYRRAHLMHRTAQTVVAEHGGIFPRDVETLATLPGIGRSTAGAIAAFAYGKHSPILDGNVKRVLARHQGISGFPGDAAVERVLWARAEALLPRRAIETYTQALMDLGATLCLRAQPRCAACPVAADCVALATGRVFALPTPRPKKALPRRAISILLIEHNGEVLLERRPVTGIWAGLWSLPETETDADLVQYCRERFGAEVAPRSPLSAIEHTFTHFRLTLTPRPCEVRNWPRRVDEPGWVWLPFGEAAGAALPAPIKKLLRELARASGL